MGLGFGFRLNLKWGFPLHSRFHSNSTFKHISASPVSVKEASFNTARLSFLSVTSEESETIGKDSLTAYAFSPSSPQILEDDLSKMEEMKMPAKENINAYKASNFGLLMQNLGVLEESFSDSDVLRLEKKILMHLSKLGALQLFHTRLSVSLQSSNFLNLGSTPTDYVGENKIRSEIESLTSRTIVRTSKREERKSRKKRLENPKILSSQLPSETNWQGPPFVSSMKGSKNRRCKRLAIAKKEAELSTGVKMISKLEQIRTALEMESGGVVSLSSWAEAAGVDEKMLQQQLHFGWHCQDELIRSTKSLVLYIARNYRGLGIALSDLLQAGKIGVLQGAERFDHTRGYRFSTYVQYWIRKSMSRLVARHARGIKVPCTLSKAINQIQKTRKAVTNSRGKYQDDNEIAKLTGLSLNKIRSASQCLRVVGSVDQKIGDSFQGKCLEFMADMSITTPEETVMRQHMRKDIHNLLAGLDSRERQVLILRYGFNNYQPKSLEEIGKLFRVSKEWIRKIEKKALTKLRNEEINRDLSHYLNLHTRVSS
ncbi:RNA polymerase sigma factor sigC [Humulus lupulus]|uniref:RNA polymerase sigma factor sigC n=1 Tax=Humulus lupulus TaxID=3486 RepID=UPI002B40FD01|nr:RNA polymerase sigma factor sigC [Humulus lupulus]